MALNIYDFMEVKPSNYLEPEVSGIVVKPIEKDFGWGRIKGYHLLSPAIAREPKRQGDGWFCEELADGRLLVAVSDISVGGDSLGADFKPITEKRLFSDLELFLGAYLKAQNPAKLVSVDILRNIITSFEPDYLSKMYVKFLWGFSVAVGLFDPKRKIADLANLGTNIVAEEKSKGKFRAILSPNRRFYTPPTFAPEQPHGGTIRPQTRGLSFQREILLATDGVITKKPLFRPPEVILEEDSSNFLVPFDPGQKAEGLYIVIQRKVI